MSRDVGLVPLPETSPDCESGGVILGWDQVKIRDYKKQN